jgi:hypothetical protein
MGRKKIRTMTLDPKPLMSEQDLALVRQESERVEQTALAEIERARLDALLIRSEKVRREAWRTVEELRE